MNGAGDLQLFLVRPPRLFPVQNEIVELLFGDFLSWSCALELPAREENCQDFLGLIRILDSAEKVDRFRDPFRVPFDHLGVFEPILFVLRGCAQRGHFAQLLFAHPVPVRQFMKGDFYLIREWSVASFFKTETGLNSRLREDVGNFL